MKTLIIPILIFSLVFVSCKKEPVSIKKSSGYFVLTQLKKPDLLKNYSGQASDSANNQFDLGDLKASKEFFFILSNGGDNPITNIEIHSNNNAFLIQPAKINSLAGKADANSDLIPLISLSVIHGVQLNGVGYAALLPMDLNTAELTISGKTVSNGDTITVNSTYTISVNAKIMDIQLIDGSNVVDLASSTMSMSSNYGGLGFIRVYTFSTSECKIINTGNVKISVQTFILPSVGGWTNDLNFDIGPAEEKIFAISSSFTIVELNSNGTITDDSKIQLGNNGRGYFAVGSYMQ